MKRGNKVIQIVLHDNGYGVRLPDGRCNPDRHPQFCGAWGEAEMVAVILRLPNEAITISDELHAALLEMSQES